MNRQIERLSCSGMTTWHQCGYKFWLHYIEGLPGDPPSEATLVGTVVHEALESIFAPEATIQASLPEAAKRAWGNNQEAIDALGDVDIQSMKRNVLSSLSLLYSAWWGTDVDGVEVEVRFDAETPVGRTASFLGLVDMVERVGHGLYVHDAKTGKIPDERSRWFDEQIEAKLDQPALYAYALESQVGTKVEGYCLDYAHDGEFASFPGSRTDGAVRRFLATWDKIMDAVEAETPPKPAPGPLCGWCPYVTMCDAGRKEVERRWALNKSVGPAKERLALR